MSDNTPTPDTGDTPPPFPSIDGNGYVTPVPQNVEDLLATPIIPLSTPTPTSAPTPAPAAATPPTPTPTPTPAQTSPEPAEPATRRGYPELYEAVPDSKISKKIKKSRNKSLDDKRISPTTLLIGFVAIAMFAALGYFIYYLLVVVAGNGNSDSTETPIGTTPVAQTAFVYPTAMPPGLAGQSLTNNPADEPTLALFASQAQTAGNPQSFAAFYGPTPKVPGVNFLVYGAEMTSTEQANVAAIGPIKAFVNETATNYVGRGAAPLTPEPVQAAGPYGGTTWCQTAELTGAPQGTYCYWSDGTYYVGVARTAGPEGAVEFANNVVQELGATPAS